MIDEYFSEINIVEWSTSLAGDDFSNSEVKKLERFLNSIDDYYRIESMPSQIKIYYSIDDGVDSYYASICKIDKYEDEWYVVTYTKKKFKCDQFDGLLENLKKFIR